MTDARTDTIVAALRVGEAGDAIRRAALDRAERDGARLVLYDLDARPSPLESPLPTGWSADGTEEQFGDRLDPDELEAAGRADLARAVRLARERGVETWAWLPETDHAGDLAAYAARCGATAIVVGARDASLARRAGVDVDVVRG
jgi:nucleotide-binding universal stress UspA family protein